VVLKHFVEGSQIQT